MNPPSNTTITVERNTPGAENAHGDAAEAWAAHLTDVDAFRQTKVRRELTDNREVAVTSYRYHLAAGLDVRHDDRILEDGATRRVVGVKHPKSPYGREFTVIDVEGVVT